MLPEKLSNGLCSLNPGVDRCSLVCDMIVSEKGEVTAYQFYPALIRSKARLTYTSVWNALNGDEQDFLVRGGNLTDINNLYALFKALLQARGRRGAADFTSAETEIVTDPQTQKIVAIRKRDHNDAHRLIEECMLAANVCAADFIGQNKAKSLYRVHDAPPAICVRRSAPSVSNSRAEESPLLRITPRWRMKLRRCRQPKSSIRFCFAACSALYTVPTRSRTTASITTPIRTSLRRFAVTRICWYTAPSVPF